MRRLFTILRIISLGLIFISSSLYGQCIGNCTTVTATLTDGSSQLWNNATVIATIQAPFGNPAGLLNNGVPINSPTNTIGTNNLGQLTISLDDNAKVVPAGSKWQFTMCPNATVANCSQVTLVITGASQNLTSQLSAALATPVVNAAPVLQRAYQDSEVNGATGSVYWNTTSNTFKGCALGPCPANAWQTVGNLGVPGAINQIPFNNGSGSFTASSNLTFTPGTNTFNALHIIGTTVVGQTINNVCTIDGTINVTLANAVTCAGTNGVIVIGNQTVPTLVAPVTIPSGVTLRIEGGNGCIITTGGFALTINGPFIAPRTKVFCGTGVTGLTLVEPEWFGSTSISTTVQAAFSSSLGGILDLAEGTYQNSLGGCWTQSNVWFHGSGMPYVNAGTTALVLGTILQGSYGFAGASNIHISNLGIDNGSIFNGGPSTADALAITGVTGCAGSSPADPLPTGVIVENTVALLSSGAVAFHGIRLEHLYGPIANNNTIYYGTHGLTIKSPYTIATNTKVYGQGTDGVIIKGDAYTNVHNVILTGVLAQTLTSANVLGTGVFLQCGGANPLVNIKVSNIEVINSPVGMEMLSDSFCSAGAGSQDAIDVNNFTYKENDNTLGLTSGFGFFSQTLSSTATNVHLNNWTIENSIGNTLVAFEAFSLSMPMNNCTFENFHVSGVVGGGSQIDGGPLYINNYTEFTTFASRPFVMLSNSTVYIKNYSGTNNINTTGLNSNDSFNYDTGAGNGIGFATSSSLFFGGQTITINATASPTILIGSGAQSGLLRVRDNTLGGSALFLIDPNSGSQLLGTSQITGLASAAGVTFSSGQWRISLSSGATPRVLSWTIYD